LKFHQSPCTFRSVAAAPFTGAWIEIPVSCGGCKHREAAPFTGAWIEIVSMGEKADTIDGRPLHGGVD